MPKRKLKNKNALKHGAFATEVILWGETAEEYEALRAGIYEEWGPSGKTEEFEADKLVDLMWRRRRLKRYAQIKMNDRISVLRDNTATSRHWENLKSFAEEFGSAATTEEVEAILSQLSPMYANTIRSKWPLIEGSDPADWGKKIEQGLKATKSGRRYEGSAEFVEAFSPEKMDGELAQHERLDAIVERTIKRLAQIKAMKQMLPAPLKNVSRTEGGKLIDLSVTQKSEDGARQLTGDIAKSETQSTAMPHRSGSQSN